jgi:2,3-dihydroxybenzoate decarboxylase
MDSLQQNSSPGDIQASQLAEAGLCRTKPEDQTAEAMSAGPLIAFEEHFSIREFATLRRDYMERIQLPVREKPGGMSNVGQLLSDFAEIRIPEMDKYGISRQVIGSGSPGIQGLTDATEAVRLAAYANDYLAEIIARWPDRFSGYASLPLQDPPAAARELERAVTQLGLSGAMLHGHTNGLYMDDPSCWVVWERAAALKVPIYIHPTDPIPGQWKIYDGYPELLSAAWNWGFETGTHALRVILSGVFDEFPDASLIIGHMGELIPFALWRLENQYKQQISGESLLEMPAGKRMIKQLPAYYVKNNLFITTSGNFSVPALQCSIDSIGADRILFAVDYPFEKTEPAVDFIRQAPISELDREAIMWRNGSRILHGTK